MTTDEAGEATLVDGMRVTAAAELPPEAYDLIDYRPIHPPVTRYRRFGRGQRARQPADGPLADEPALQFSEALRVQLANKRRPVGAALALRCDGRDRHPLLWLVPSPWGLVPVTRTCEEVDEDDAGPVHTRLPMGGQPISRRTSARPGRRLVSRFHGEDLTPGRPRTLHEWPDARPLPPASCPCHAEVVLTVPEVRRWLGSGKRNVTQRRSGSRI